MAEPSQPVLQVVEVKEEPDMENESNEEAPYTGNRSNNELLYCMKNYVDLYGDAVDPKELCESLQEGHGFDVDLETVTSLLETLQSKPRILYGREYKDYTKLASVPSKTETDDGANGVSKDSAAPSSPHGTTGEGVPRERKNTTGKRKIKLTQDILYTVSATLDEEPEVHSLLSLKRALEKKGIFISKTSVYRALEKLGRSIVERKKGKPLQVPEKQHQEAPPAIGPKGPLDLSIKPAAPPLPPVAAAVRKRSTRSQMTVAEMLAKSCRPVTIRQGPRRIGRKRRRIGTVDPTGTAQQLVAVTAVGQTMLLSGQPTKKLRALLPKPSPVQHSATIAGISTSTPEYITIQKVQVPVSKPTSALMQTEQDGVAITRPANIVSLPNIVRTPQIVNVSGTSATYTSDSAPSPSKRTSVNVPAQEAPVQKGALKKEKDPIDEGREATLPVVKIEIDDPSYCTEQTKDSAPDTSASTNKPTQNSVTLPKGTISTPNMSNIITPAMIATITPPPRIESLHRTEEYHPAERLTKSVSPQLLSSAGYDLHREENHDVKGRAIQQFRLSKAIGRIANMRTQGQTVSRAPRKPSIVFHRPSSNRTPIPFRVRSEPPTLSSPQREEDVGGYTGLAASAISSTGSYPNYPRQQARRTFQLMRAARNAQLRSLMRSSGVHKLHPTGLSNGKTVTPLTTHPKRQSTRLRLKSASPVYYQSDLNEEEFLPALEIDPPDNHDAAAEPHDETDERRPSRVSGNENTELMKDMFKEMTKQMKQLSQHMETIQGQLQMIVEFLPGLQPRIARQESQSEPLNMTNGHLRSSSPLSNGDQSPDTDDGVTDGNGGQLDIALDLRELPTIGSTESDALIKEVMDDYRWDQMTVYAGAPRLAIALARYCIFGTKVLMESSVTGRNSKSPLSHSAMKKIKDLLQEKYGHRCNQLEFEMVWKTSRESISQLCKRLRRKYQLAERVSSGSQDDFVIECKQ